MNEEFAKLPADIRGHVERVIAECAKTGEAATATVVEGKSDVYAHPHALGISWGYNGPPHGYCLARGIKPKD